MDYIYIYIYWVGGVGSRTDHDTIEIPSGQPVLPFFWRLSLTRKDALPSHN